MACLHREGALGLHTPFVHESIVGTQFTGQLVGECEVRVAMLCGGLFRVLVGSAVLFDFSALTCS